MARIVSLVVLLVLIVILGITFFRVVMPFILPLFLAGMTAVICQPVYRYFLRRTKNRVSLSAGLTTAAIMSALMIPMAVGTLIASLQLYTFAHAAVENQALHKSLKEASQKAGSTTALVFSHAVAFGNQFLPKDQQRDPDTVFNELKKKVQISLSQLGDRSLGRAAGTTVGLLAETAAWLIAAGIGLLMYGVALYYFLADGSLLIEAAEKLIPVHADYQRELLEEFAKVVRSVVIATFLAAIAQGIATVLALWFFGFDHLFVLLILSMLAALIPMAGTWLVWFPCAVILFSSGHWVQALLLSVYGAAFVGFLDNVIRTYVLNSDTKLHPLLAFISVLGGLQVMGLWGVFIGPIVASVLHALVKIFNHELFELSRTRASGTATEKATPAVTEATASPPATTVPPPTSLKEESNSSNQPQRQQKTNRRKKK